MKGGGGGGGNSEEDAMHEPLIALLLSSLHPRI